MSEIIQLPLNTKQVNEAHAVLSALIASDKENDFIFRGNVRTRFSGNFRKTKPIFEEYETERMRLVKEYGEVTDPKKGTITVKPENQEKFAAELKAMQDEPTDVVLNSINEVELFGVTPEQEEKGAKANQVDIDLIAFMQDIGLLK